MWSHLLHIKNLARLAQGSNSGEQWSWFLPRGVCDHSQGPSTLGPWATVPSPRPPPRPLLPALSGISGVAEAVSSCYKCVPSDRPQIGVSSLFFILGHGSMGPLVRGRVGICLILESAPTAPISPVNPL